MTFKDAHSFRDQFLRIVRTQIPSFGDIPKDINAPRADVGDILGQAGIVQKLLIEISHDAVGGTDVNSLVYRTSFGRFSFFYFIVLASRQSFLDFWHGQTKRRHPGERSILPATSEQKVEFRHRAVKQLRPSERRLL
ncbi:MAG: hypothetical protein VCD66_07380 [Alphaproteobacteria bacterium]